MVITTMLSLTFLFPGATVLADTDTGSSTKPAVKPVLGIRAPQIIEVNQSFTLQIVNKHSRKPESGVSVYQVKADAMSKLTVSDKDFTAILGNYAAAAASAGFLIGKTDENGNLNHTFTEVNNYILIAIQDGFVPGFTRVRIVQAMQKKLNITAPAIAIVGQQITITVTEKGIVRSAVGTGKVVNPVQNAGAGPLVTAPGQIKVLEATKAGFRPIVVPGASVYAIKIDASVNSDTMLIKPDSKSNAAAEQYSALAKEKGFLIGKTDENGRLVYTFTEKGRYMLMAVMDGFIPDFTRIAVVLAPQKKLHLDAPDRAVVGQQITIFVGETNYPIGVVPMPIPAPATQSLSLARFTPVANASIYAVKYNEADAINKFMDSISESDSTVIEKHTSIARATGRLLGTTNEKGQLSCALVDTGKHILIAIKDGYRPDFTRIEIVLAEKKALRLNAPESAIVGQPVTLTVTERIRFGPGPHPDIQGSSGSTAATPDLSQATQSVKGQVDVWARPVAGASVYAARFAESETIIEPFINNDGTPSTSAEKYLAQAKRWLIGTTDENGQVVTKFADAGRYIFVAVKDNYLPAFDKMRIYPKPSPSNTTP